MYEITFDLPDAGLPGEGQSQLKVPLGNDQDNTTIATIIPVDAYAPEAPLQHNPTQSCRSAVGNQPYDQDNISTQLLIKNGKMSSRKKTKHIKAKFFFIKDRIDDGEITVLPCQGDVGGHYDKAAAGNGVSGNAS